MNCLGVRSLPCLFHDKWQAGGLPTCPAVGSGVLESPTSLNVTLPHAGTQAFPFVAETIPAAL